MSDKEDYVYICGICDQLLKKDRVVLIQRMRHPHKHLKMMCNGCNKIALCEQGPFDMDHPQYRERMRQIDSERRGPQKLGRPRKTPILD